MKAKKELPFETLMAYAEGGLSESDRHEVDQHLDDDLNEMIEGLRTIYKKEKIGALVLEKEFQRIEKRTEKVIQLHANFSNHLIELNRQLRSAAAVFVLIFSSSFLMGFVGDDTVEHVKTEQHGPYDLAFGSKVAP